MGEYLKYKGEPVKLGTCESLYYTTYEQYKKAFESGDLEKMEGNDEPENYLNGSYMFRFPFPDETKVKIGDHEPFNRGYKLQVPKGPEIFHGEIFLRTGGPAIGINLPCPQTKEFTAMNLKVTDWDKYLSFLQIEVVYQKPINGHLETVIRCPWCGELTRLGSENLEILAGEWQGMDLQIIDLIKEGYLIPV